MRRLGSQFPSWLLVPFGVLGAMFLINGVFWWTIERAALLPWWIGLPTMGVGGLLAFSGMSSDSSWSSHRNTGLLIFLGAILFVVGCTAITGDSNQSYPDWYDGCQPGRC